MKPHPLLFLSLLALAGCSLWPPPAPPAATPPADAAPLFDRGLEQLSRGEASEALEQLRQVAPASPWSHRAELLLELHQQSDRLRTERNRAVRRQQALEDELTVREAYIQQLKELIIRNERTR